ncbi:hypothetical protein OEV98_11060 [Caldibacillus lycopersici]|uniref:Uncharacterized protein n=1 Tax=Perspicuibacillus lycopersici TaxID=1325689 RepID=A0AAE3IWD1_9BACI|nr:hypothetical protein [Perspicuibacillus lycopersici]MCU9614099.1 hypothetical protein [Perspicuibacillus lycopersici]
MGVKISGLDEFDKFLNDLQKKANEASGEVSFPELFNDDFMRTYTKLNDIEEFFNKSPFKIETQEDFENLDEIELNKYVKEVTSFLSWEEMKEEAGTLYMKKKLGF